MSISITRRQLASMASVSALIATMSVATVPTTALAASGSVIVKGASLTAKIINPTSPVTGKIDATGYDVAVYFAPGHPGTVANAEISGAKQYGVVADGTTVTVSGSKFHDIGDSPLDGVQYGNPIFYYDGARGTISGNDVYNFQKNGITVSGMAADGIGLSTVKTSATVANNIVTGEGHIDWIAQNGIVIRTGADAVVKGNVIRGFFYTPADNEATGLLSYEAGTVAVAGNTFAGNEVDVYGPVKTIRDVHGTVTVTTSRHSFRIVLSSEAQPANTVMGNRLSWVVKVDGRVRLSIQQGFGGRYVFSRYYATGYHRVLIYRNGVIVKNFLVRP